MEKKRFLICNMDERKQYLAEILQRTGDEVVEENEFDESEPFFGMLLPVTQTDEYFRRLQGHMKKGMYIFGSNFSEDAKMWAKTMQFTLVDYMKEPGVAEKNAIATAEGVIAEAITEMKQNLSGSKCLVAGYGRCGSVIAEKLLAFGCEVAILEQSREKCTLAEQNGCKWEKDVGLLQYDLIINTVPALIFGESLLCTLKKDAVILDIATKPGGVDFSYCEKNNIKAKRCPGLPAKYSPKTSAEVLAEVVRKYEKSGERQ